MVNIRRIMTAYNHSAPNNIQYIVIHYTGNKNDTAAGNAHYFSVNRGASAHYFVDDTEIVQIIEDKEGSWHCGDGGNRYGIGNHNSIGIEMCGTANGTISATTVNNTLDLVKMLQKKYGINNDHVVRHYDASRKNCPSAFAANNWARWWDFKARLAGHTVSATPATNTSSSTVTGGMYVTMKKYVNGSTPEPVYSSTDCATKIGSLDPHETCDCLGQIDGRAVVQYKVDGKNVHKIGYCKWLGGIK